MFFLTIACQSNSKMCPYCNIGRSKIMQSRLFVLFSLSLFLNSPYCVLTTFSQVSCTRKLKKTHKKALKTFLVAHCEKTCPEITHGSQNVKKTTPTDVQMDDLATTKNLYFSSIAPFCDTWAPRSQKTCPRHTFFQKSRQIEPHRHPKLSKSIQLAIFLNPICAFFQMGGFPLRYIYIYIYIFPVVVVSRG